MRSMLWTLLGVMTLAAPCLARGDEILFQDQFQNKKLSEKWTVVGLKEADYRIRDGKLEMRVQPGNLSGKMPMIKVMLPFRNSDSVVVSVKITILDAFSEEGELAGVAILEDDGLGFVARKELRGKQIIYSPGAVNFKGKPGEEEDFKKYETVIVKEDPMAGPLRILANQGYAYFQVGPSATGKFHNHFHEAISPRTQGFALVACGAPQGKEHWVRFEDFRIFRR